MQPDDNDKKKKKKKKFPEDEEDFPYSNPFEDSFPWEGMDFNEIMERFLPYLQGSSFGKMIDEMLRNLMKNLENIDSTDFDEMLKKPFVYGFKVGVGPDGKPDFSQFGNLKPNNYGDLETSDVREPLIDVFKEEDIVRVIAEVPGVGKGDIKLTGSERTLTIKAHSPSRKYEKSVSLPVAVKIDTAKAKYRNGVLEVIITRKNNKKTEEDYDINID